MNVLSSANFLPCSQSSGMFARTDLKGSLRKMGLFSFDHYGKIQNQVIFGCVVEVKKLTTYVNQIQPVMISSGSFPHYFRQGNAVSPVDTKRE